MRPLNKAKNKFYACSSVKTRLLAGFFYLFYRTPA
jgi:hypothetical protein